MTELEEAARPLLTFHGAVRIREQRTGDGQREYLVMPLSQGAALDVLANEQIRSAWYAGIDAAMQVAEAQSIEPHPLSLSRLRAGLLALRHPKDKRDE